MWSRTFWTSHSFCRQRQMTPRSTTIHLPCLSFLPFKWVHHWICDRDNSCGFCSEFGGVCVHHQHSQVTDRGLLIRMPVTSPGTSSTQRRKLPYHRMEAGNQLVLRPEAWHVYIELNMGSSQDLWIPTFVYLVTFFLLVDAGTLCLNLADATECTFSDLIPLTPSEWQIQLLVLTKYVSWFVAGHHFNHWYSRALVCPMLLEDQHKENVWLSHLLCS